MRWAQAEKAVKAGQSVHRRAWKPGSVVTLWQGKHIIRVKHWGDQPLRTFFHPSRQNLTARDWELQPHSERKLP